MSLSGIAHSLSGMQQAVVRQRIAAHTIANLATPGFNVDLAREIVESILATRTFQMNARVLRAGDETLGTLLNLKG